MLKEQEEATEMLNQLFEVALTLTDKDLPHNERVTKAVNITQSRLAGRILSNIQKTDNPNELRGETIKLIMAMQLGTDFIAKNLKESKILRA